jgi:hypothetical protein
MFQVNQVSHKDWIKVSEEAMVASFGARRSRELERFDFALAAIDKGGNLSGFITCIEMDAETLYWQFGGTFSNYTRSIAVFAGYRDFLKWAEARYKRVTTRIENKNLSMLKLALAAGFIVVGTYYANQKLYLELTNEFKGE